LSDRVRRSSTSEGGSETHRGNYDMRWVSQGLNPSYELIESASSCHGSTDQ
jgi:hypothetical protein